MFDRGKQPEYEMDLENRFVAPEVTENDRDNELSLRPHTLEEYIGQEQVKENLSVFMQAARLRGEPLDHVLLYGPPAWARPPFRRSSRRKWGSISVLPAARPSKTGRSGCPAYQPQ